MADSIYADDAYQSARIALDALSRRQEVIGQNIANVDTPGYQAQTVNFENTLKSAMAKGSSLKMETTHTGHLAAPNSVVSMVTTLRQGGTTRADGNDVDIDTENAQLASDALRYETLSQLVSKKLLLLKTIASAR